MNTGTMTKTVIATTPGTLSKAVAKALKTTRKEARVRKKKRRKVPMKILPPRHVSRSLWATRSREDFVAAKAKLKSLAQNKKFTVPSESCEGKAYQIVCDDSGAWTCTCPDYKCRHSTDGCRYAFYCKHIAVCIDKLQNKK